jgi:hypothetical protein
MSGGKILCDHCNSVISQYYHEGYKGNRGKCHICNTDFPLE